MTVKTKKVYYCDFCNKHSLRPLIEHEKRCTMNINRICGMCGAFNQLPIIIEKLQSKIKIKHYDDAKEFEYYAIDLNDILAELEEDCPACILSIIRLLSANGKLIECQEFNYEKAKEEWWKLHNEEQDENYEMEFYYHDIDR